MHRVRASFETRPRRTRLEGRTALIQHRAAKEAPMVMHLDEAAIRGVLRWDPLIAAMEEALAAFSSGQVLQPVRNMLTIEEGKRYLGIMPAVAAEAMGLKLVSFYPGNAGSGLPTHMAMVLLFRPETGEPLAVMDGRLI